MILFHISKWLKIIPESIQSVNSVCSPTPCTAQPPEHPFPGLTTELSPALRIPPTLTFATAAQKGLLTAWPGDILGAACALTLFPWPLNGHGPVKPTSDSAPITEGQTSLSSALPYFLLQNYQQNLIHIPGPLNDKSVTGHCNQH